MSCLTNTNISYQDVFTVEETNVKLKNNTYLQLLEQNIDKTFNKKCHNILVTGDFNMDFLVNPINKMSRLVSAYNARQLIQSQTHFTERSHSLIDLIFIKHNSQLISSFVPDPFVPDLIRFHCPIVCVLKFFKLKISSYKGRLWCYDRGDYLEYRRIFE